MDKPSSTAAPLPGQYTFPFVPNDGTAAFTYWINVSPNTAGAGGTTPPAPPVKAGPPAPATPGVASIQALRKPDRKDGVACYIYGDIGGFDGVTADSFRAALEGAGEFTDLTLYINSGGGSVFEAKAIMAQMDRLAGNGVRITAEVDGLAASAASLIAINAAETVMHPGAKMMIHLPSALAAGNARDFRKMADLLESETETMIGLYAEKTGLPKRELRAMLEAETYLTAAEAVDKGFADKVAGDGNRELSAADSAFTGVVAKTRALTSDRSFELSRMARVVSTLAR